MFLSIEYLYFYTEENAQNILILKKHHSVQSIHYFPFLNKTSNLYYFFVLISIDRSRF